MGRGLGTKATAAAGALFGRRRGEGLHCGNCGAERDPKDIFCGKCCEDFTGTGAPMVLEPYPPGSDS